MPNQTEGEVVLKSSSVVIDGASLERESFQKETFALATPKIAELSTGATVNKVLGILKQVNPFVNFANKTQRKAVEEILNQLGVERTLKLTQYAVSVQGEDYAPVITTPLDLKNKMAKLMIFFQRNNKGSIVAEI